MSLAKPVNKGPIEGQDAEDDSRLQDPSSDRHLGTCELVTNGRRSNMRIVGFMFAFGSVGEGQWSHAVYFQVT